MATAKPARTRKQPSAKPLTPAQLRSQKNKIARERTEQLVHQAYERQLRQTKIAIALQQAKADAMKDAGIKPVTPAAKQQPPKAAKPATRGKKPSGRKPPRRR